MYKTYAEKETAELARIAEDLMLYFGTEPVLPEAFKTPIRYAAFAIADADSFASAIEWAEGLARDDKYPDEAEGREFVLNFLRNRYNTFCMANGKFYFLR